MDRQLISNEIREINMPEILLEFCIALEDEIKAIKIKASSSSVHLSNGKRIGTHGDQWQYVFNIEDTLNQPDDSPIQLSIPGKTPIEAIIISIEYPCVSISINQDIGEFIPFATLRSDMSILLRKLINRIESNINTENVEALRMLGGAEVYDGVKYVNKINEAELNNAQLEAVRSAVGRNMTYIWGPPGTGKTKTISRIIKELYDRDRTILVVSHTNIAVDGAISKTASELDEIDIENGSIIRMGTVKEGSELMQKYPQVSLKYQEESRSEELKQKIGIVENQTKILNKDIERLQKDTLEYAWFLDYGKKKQKIIFAIDKYEINSIEYDDITEEIRELQEQEKEFGKQISLVNEYLSLKTKYDKYIEILTTESIRKQSSNEKINMLKTNLKKNEEEIRLSIKRLDLEKDLSNYISIGSQDLILGKLKSDISKIKSQIEGQLLDIKTLQEKLLEASKTNAFMRTVRGIPKPEKINNDINSLGFEVDRLNEKLSSKNAEYDKKYGVYTKTLYIHSELQKLPKTSMKILESQKTVILEDVKNYQNIISECGRTIDKLYEKIINAEKSMSDIESNLGDEVENILSKYNEVKAKIDIKLKESKSTKKVINDNRKIIDGTIMEMKIIFNHDFALEDMERGKLIDFFESYFNSKKEKYIDFNIEETKDSIDLLESDLKKLTDEITELRNKFSEIEMEIISEAKIVGTTLTKAYMSDILQGRKFDTVILDEASMAPIPALWVASLMSNKNIVIVGDFKQLPPIVLSNTQIAEKWLGRDIFEESGVKEKYQGNCPPDNFVILRKQYRMEKDIADIANRYYGGKLETPEREWRLDDKKIFEEWYNNIDETDSAVVLVDTGSLNAWVTSVSKGNQTSRLNFLSSALSVNIAEQITSKYITANNDLPEGSKVLIISPYRPHTILTNKLIKDVCIDDYVRAGTVHSFQGAEADVVIFDLVVDEPHFRVNLFMNMLDEQMERLFNVSMTRAKFKLFIIGNFSYCLAKGKNAEIGKLLRYLINERNFPVKDAKELSPKIYEKGLSAQKSAIGGTVESKKERLVVKQDVFYKYFCDDLNKANKVIIIYSPFITKDRITYLQPCFQAAIERNVSIYIITKSIQERSKREMESYNEIEDHVKKMGCNLIHKKGMHEKIVFIDNEVLWSGSLNPLSFSSTQEVMERRKNEKVIQDYMEILRTSDLIDCIGKPESKCPICGSEMIASEGNDEPYYWRCVNDDGFTRGINQEYPMNGELKCKCGAELEFGYWGEDICWRCTKNKHHHQKLFKSQLKLPKMMNKIPKKEVKNVSIYFGINLSDKKGKKKMQVDREGHEQINLFD